MHEVGLRQASLLSTYLRGGLPSSPARVSRAFSAEVSLRRQRQKRKGTPWNCGAANTAHPTGHQRKRQQGISDDRACQHRTGIKAYSTAVSIEQGSGPKARQSAIAADGTSKSIAFIGGGSTSSYTATVAAVTSNSRMNQPPLPTSSNPVKPSPSRKHQPSQASMAGSTHLPARASTRACSMQ